MATFEYCKGRRSVSHFRPRKTLQLGRSSGRSRRVNRQLTKLIHEKNVKVYGEGCSGEKYYDNGHRVEHQGPDTVVCKKCSWSAHDADRTKLDQKAFDHVTDVKL
jgi:hypothetical protein